MLTRLGGELCHCAIVIEPRHGGEIARIQVWCITLCDEGIGVRRVTHDQHFDVTRGIIVECLTLDRKYGCVGLEQILALHPWSPRSGTNQQRVVCIRERHTGVIGVHNLFKKWKSAVVQFHDHALHGI